MRERLGLIRRKKSKLQNANESDPDPVTVSTPNPAIHATLIELAADEFQMDPHNEGLDIHTISLGRPVVAWLQFLQLTHKPNAPMLIRHMEVEDARLQRHGLGSLMLVKAVQCNLEYFNSHVETVSVDPGNIALAGVMQKVFGADNVTWEASGESSAPRQSAGKAGRNHLVHGLTAAIDKDRIMSISVTEKLHQLAETGHAIIP